MPKASVGSSESRVSPSPVSGSRHHGRNTVSQEGLRLRRSPNHLVNSYEILLKQVRDAYLLPRRRWLCPTLYIILMTAWANTWIGFILLQNTWSQLLIAAGKWIAMGCAFPGS